RQLQRGRDSLPAQRPEVKFTHRGHRVAQMVGPAGLPFLRVPEFLPLFPCLGVCWSAQYKLSAHRRAPALAEGQQNDIESPTTLKITPGFQPGAVREQMRI